MALRNTLAMRLLELADFKKNFLFILYIFFILGFFFFPTSKLHSVYFYVAVMFPFLILVFMRKVDLRLFFSSRIFFLTTIFLFYMVATIFWAEQFVLPDLFKYGRRAFYVLIFIAVTIHLYRTYPNFLPRLLQLLFWATVIAGIANIIFYYGQHPFPDARLSGYGRLENPIQASSIYGIAFIACVLFIKQQSNVKAKLLYLAALLFMFSYILLSQSRGPLIALAITMFAWGCFDLFRSKDVQSNYHITIFGVGLAVSVVGVMLFVVYPEFFQSFVSRGGGGVGYRLEIWGHFVAEAKNALWLGHGLNTNTHIVLSDGTAIQNPHGFYVGTLFYGGAIGLFLMLSMVASALLVGFVRARDPRGLALASMFLFGAICVAADGYTLLQHPKPYWLFFLLPLALIAASEFTNQTSRENQAL